MARLLITVSDIALTADCRNTPIARRLCATAPFEAPPSFWGEEIYFAKPVSVELESDACAIVEAGEIAFWIPSDAIAIGFGPTPVSRGEEIRLAEPCNVWAITGDDVRKLAAVASGDVVRVTPVAD